MNNKEWDVIVIGAGPAGSTAAAYLARLGHSVLIIEKDEFPRHRIGESLLPSMMPILEDFDLIKKCRDAGFIEKNGATFIWGKSKEAWEINFSDTPFLPSSFAFHVDRAKFDKILLENARDCGAVVYMQSKVISPIYEQGRVVGVNYVDENNNEKTVSSTYVIDASGSTSIVGRTTGERSYDDKMRQLAIHSYYENVTGAPGYRAGHITVESTPKGWFWYIPVESEELGEISVGLVTGQEFTEEIKNKGKDIFFDEALALAPNVSEMLGKQSRKTKPLRVIRDWAYTCERAAGPGFYLAGDAAAFLDPLLSTGVTLAMLAGYSASVCIHTSLVNTQMEESSYEFYANNYKEMYEVTRDFLHYFYAGNASAYEDEIFWNARKMLNFDENIGAKQAFSFLINTIPGNPHPAVKKQIPMFQQFMDNLDHSVNRVEAVSGTNLIQVSQLEDKHVPIVNGQLKDTWQLNKELHTLERVKGLTFDRERPVFSSTSSWLLGKNIASLSDTSWEILNLIDGKKTWGAIHKEIADTLDDELSINEHINPLLNERYILVLNI